MSETTQFGARESSMNQARTVLPERNLDVLRAMAVLSVLVWHVAETSWNLHGEGRLGRIGVLAFFVHTSLVLLSSIERGGTEGNWVRTFYFRRAARIYPLAWVTIVVCVWLALPYSTAPAHTVALSVAHVPKAIVANVLLVQNLVGTADVSSPLWTLPLEMQMYVLLPLCYLLAIKSPKAVIGGLALAIALGSLVLWTEFPGSWRLSVLGYAPCFLAGVLAFALLRNRPTKRTHSSLWFGILALLWTLGLVAPVTFAPVGWAFCLVLALCIVIIPELPESLVTRGSYYIAKYSYGIYLLHMPAWSIAFKIEAPAVVQWAVYVALLFALPWAAYKYIESPIIEWARGPRVGPPRLLQQAA